MAELLLPTVGLRNDGTSRRLSTDMRVRNFTPDRNIAFSIRPSENMKDGIAIADTIEKYQLAMKAEKERALVNEAVSLYQEDLASIETDYMNKKMDHAVNGFEDYQNSIKNLEKKYGQVFKDSRMQQALNSRASDYAVQARVNGRNHHDKEVQAKSFKELEGRLDKSVEHFFTHVGSPFDKQNHDEMLANMQAYLSEQGYSDPTSDAYQLASKNYFDKAFYGPIRSLISRDPQRALMYLEKVKGDISQMGYAQFYEIAQDKIETNAIRAAQRAEIAEARKARLEAKKQAEIERAWQERTEPLKPFQIAQMQAKNMGDVIKEYEAEQGQEYNPDNPVDKFTVYSRAYGRTMKQVDVINSERLAVKNESNLSNAFIMNTYHRLKAIGKDGDFKRDPLSCFTAEEKGLIRSLHPNETDEQINDSINSSIIERNTDSTYAYEKKILQMSDSELLELDEGEVLSNVSSAFVPTFQNKLAQARQNAVDGKIQNGNKDVNNLILSESFDIDMKDKNKVENLFYVNMTNDLHSDMLNQMRAEAKDRNGYVDISKLSPQRQKVYWYTYKNLPNVRERIDSIKNYEKLIKNFYSDHKAQLSVNYDEVSAKAELGKIVSDLYYKNGHRIPSEYQLEQEVRRLDSEKIKEYREVKKARPNSVTNIKQLQLFFGDPIWNDSSYENELYWEHDPVMRAKSYAPENRLSGNVNGEWRFRED